MTTLAEVMDKLASLGTEQTRITFLRHGATEPLFGVKIGDLKKLVKDVKKDQKLARALYETGNGDAMYLSGLTVDPKAADKAMLQEWVKAARWYSLAEYTVAGVAAESPYARELAREWILSAEEMIAACGWSTYANYISITPDSELDLEEIRGLLWQIGNTIHEAKNRVRYTMNGFVIMVGASVIPLHEEAVRVAKKIGKVHVEAGQTACKVPLADDYIEKMIVAGKVGMKKKTCIC